MTVEDAREFTTDDIMEAWQRFATTDEGRIIIADLGRRFGFMNQSTLRPGDPISTAHNEGMRTVMVFIHRAIEGTLPTGTDQEIESDIF